MSQSVSYIYQLETDNKRLRKEIKYLKQLNSGLNYHKISGDD